MRRPRNRKIEYITDEAARKATFKKRKKGLLKKVDELSTMCGVDACAVISNPYEAAPDVYPSHLEAQRVLERFRGLPEMKQQKNMVNQEGFFQQRIAKATEQLRQLSRDNREMELTNLMLQVLPIAGTHGEGGGNATVLNGLDFNDINELGRLVDQNLIDVELQMKKVRAGKMKRGVDDNNYTEYAPQPQPRERALMLAPPPPKPVAWHAGEASGEGWHAASPETRVWSPSESRRQLPPTTAYGPYAPPQPCERTLMLIPPLPKPVAWNAGEASAEGWHAAPPEARGFWSASDVPRQLPPTLTAPPVPEIAAMQQPPYSAQSASGWVGTPKQQ